MSAIVEVPPVATLETTATPPASTSKRTAAKKEKATTTKKAAAPKAKAAPKPKSKVTASKEASTRPPWKDIIKECITLHKEDVRAGVSRATIKKYAEEKYQMDLSGTNIYQLNRAIATGVEGGVFVLPKGPSGKVKLAPKAKTAAGASKENSKPPSKSVTKPAATTKKPAAKAAPAKPKAAATTKKPAATPKKALAGKPKAASSTGKKTSAATKRGAAKKSVTGTTATTKAKAAATKKAPAKKTTAAATKAASTTKKAPASGAKPRSKPASKPASKAKKPSQPHPLEPEQPPRHKPSSPPNAAASSSRQTHSVAPHSPDDIPDFPPPDVILHKDDAGSKVFLAIARSLLSVDNRATTVKDLADLAILHGLACQNTSAATQAITTYLRMHNERCEADHDQPLLLSHSLSGTDADDDLIPALYSLQGGNPRKVSPARRTNFRKNTAVWYLSRATGAPCPFARAGIRLCDYTHLDEEIEDRDRKRRRPAQDETLLGQKRKRPHRSCAARDSSDEDLSENEIDDRPQKKLTLRIRLNCPSLKASRPPEEQSQLATDDDEDSDSSSDDMDLDASTPEQQRSCSPEQQEEEESWRLPPYPRRSISIPSYTPSYEGPYPIYPDLHNTYRRSPSLAHSIGSLPPDSEDEDDFHISMTRTHAFSEESTSESDMESEDGETQFESPGPRSPSAPLIPPHGQVTVKEEPRDLQGMLDAWDDFDSSLAENKVSGVDQVKPKSEPCDFWDWDAPRDHWSESPHIKQEDLSFDSLFPPPSLLSSSPSSSSASDLPPLLHNKVEDEDSQRDFDTIRPRSKTVPILSTIQFSASAGSVPPTIATRNNSISGTAPESANPQAYTSPANLTHSIASLIQSMNSLCSSGVSPSSLILAPTSNVVVVHTCQPCTPTVTATQIEDISVYQMVLGSFHFLRRIDTDFVNLSPIIDYLNGPTPVESTVSNLAIVRQGSAAVTGKWVPLAVAQAYLRDHPAKSGEFDVFLSDELFERFPTALQDFHRSNAPGRMLNQFGRPFASTLREQQQQQLLPIVTATEMLARQQQQHSPLIVIPASTADAYALPAAMAIAERQQEEMRDVPLSATEQEIFELCVVPDWDKDSCPSTATLPLVSNPDDSMEDEKQEEGTGGDGDVSDTSSLTSLESISSPAVSLKEMPAPSQSASSSSSVSAAAPDGGAMEGVVAAAASCAPTPVPVSPAKRAAPSEQNEEQRSSRPLRRSKRVADLAASHSARPRTRGGRGSRNSIS
ncbi:hypothetical protein MD484_g2779, partial [Candolleomyces efflorescens]